MAGGGPLIQGRRPVKIAVRCQGYEHVQRGECAHYAESTFQCDPSAAFSLCPLCIWTALLLQTPLSRFLFITLMHSLTGQIQTLSDSFTHTHTQMCSLQSVSCCPNTSTVGARSLLPIWPTGLRERHLISPLPPDRRGLIVFPVRVKNSESSSAAQEPRSGNFLIPLLPVLSSLCSLFLTHHAARGRLAPPNPDDTGPSADPAAAGPPARAYLTATSQITGNIFHTCWT